MANRSSKRPPPNRVAPAAQVALGAKKGARQSTRPVAQTDLADTVIGRGIPKPSPGSVLEVDPESGELRGTFQCAEEVPVFLPSYKFLWDAARSEYFNAGSYEQKQDAWLRMKSVLDSLQSHVHNERKRMDAAERADLRKKARPVQVESDALTVEALTRTMLDA